MPRSLDGSVCLFYVDSASYDARAQFLFLSLSLSLSLSVSLSIYIYVYVFMYLCMYVCIYLYICIYIYVCIYLCLQSVAATTFNVLNQEDRNVVAALLCDTDDDQVESMLAADARTPPSDTKPPAPPRAPPREGVVEEIYKT